VPGFASDPTRRGSALLATVILLDLDDNMAKRAGASRTAGLLA